MNDINGQCSCGTVKYKFKTDVLKAYQCHCSVCRKATGSAYSTTLMAPKNDFEWLSGKKSVSSFSKENGYKVNFCSHCGSPVPNEFRNLPFYSVPVGSIDGDNKIDIVAQIFLGSKAKWEKAGLQGEKFSEMPTLDEMMGYLHAAGHP